MSNYIQNPITKFKEICVTNNTVSLIEFNYKKFLRKFKTMLKYLKYVHTMRNNEMLT